MSARTAGEKLVRALKSYSACDIGDALVKLKYPFGGYLDGISMFSSTRQGARNATTTIIGPAKTVKMVPTADQTSPKPPVHFADSSEPGKVLYIQQPRGMHSACFGGLMAKRTQMMQASGVVIDGKFRDITEIQNLGLPLFARASSILGSNTFTRASEIDVPLQFKDDLWINPGDLLVADNDGVVVVPPSLVGQVVELCQQRKEIDEKTLAALDAGETMGGAISRFRK